MRVTQLPSFIRPLRPPHFLFTDRAAAARKRALLRDILRGASYLPDELARQHTHRLALERFRRHKDEQDEERITRLLASGRHSANQLRRANEGEHKTLLDVLMQAYGRRGPRRRELLQPLLGSGTLTQKEAWLQDVAEFKEEDIPEEYNRALHSLEASDENPENELPEMPRLSPALRCLVDAQLRANAPKVHGHKLRKLRNDIPAVNAWLRPMPKTRVRNLAAQGYADLLGRVHSPLPQNTWQRLQQLALAKEPPKVPPFRSAPHSIEPSAANDALEMVATKPRPDRKKALGNREARNITPRFLQRLYKQVLACSPKMVWHKDRHDWDVIWES